MGWLPMMSRAISNICLSSPRIGRMIDLSACLAPRGSELPNHPVHQVSAGRLSIFELVFEAHRLPLERAHLVERLHFDPLDILHGCDKSRDAVDIRGIVGFAGDKREADPDRLTHRRK